MNAGLLSLFFACAAIGGGPAIVVDNRPERGVPAEALAQMHDQHFAQEEARRLRNGQVTLRAITESTIKTVRIRYFNKDTWATEAEAQAYLAGYLANDSLHAAGFQVWSQLVGVPEIECFVEFTDEYKKRLRDAGKSCAEGRLLLWNTESCYRDAAGRWWFVSTFDHFHRAHPKGTRTLAKGAPAVAPGAERATPAPPPTNLPAGKWSVRFLNGVVEECTIGADGTAAVAEPLRSSGGKAEGSVQSLTIAYDDDRMERWTPAGQRFLVEHWFPRSQMETGTPVLGIAERMP